MSHYAVDIDLANANESHTQVAELTGVDKRVLDVGCWTGDLGAALKQRGCTVDGFELDAEAAAIARDRLDTVVVGNLEHTSLTEHFEAGAYDVVIFADVLEHLMDPSAALRDAMTLLAQGGRIVISVPNVTHGSLRLALLQGRWQTTDTGLLDRTHVRFYSREGLLKLVDDAGLVVEDLRGTTADPLSVEVQIDDEALPEHIVEWVRDQPDAFIYQFQLSARPRRAGETSDKPPTLVPGAEVSAVRPHDRHTEARIRAGRDALIMKDHVLGLQATATSARARAAELQARVRRMRARMERAEARTSELRKRISELENELAQPGWKRAARKAVRKLRS